ncbi:MAG: hypothetical protein Q9O62_00565 [Ardenticatenia bacterium]|nr:hypothetical protein [Ardenticatenia bacterium]
MVKRLSVLLLPLLISTSILLLMWGTITYAQGTVVDEDTALRTEPTGAPGADLNTSFLILPLPWLDGVRPDDQPFRFEAMLSRAVQPVLEELVRLQAEGLIADFTLLPHEYAIRVTPATPEGMRAVNEMKGALVFVSSAQEEGNNPACAAKAILRAMEDTLWAQQARTAMGELALLRTKNVTLTLQIYVRQGYQYSSVSGSTLPNTRVTMTLRGPDGTVKVTETTTSTASGFYAFRPTWQPCEYTWVAVPGDTVEVTAAGKTIKSTVAPISVFADPTENTVSGVTAPNRDIFVVVFQTDAVCQVTWSTATSTSDGSGTFSTAIPGGFDRSGSVIIWVNDPNGNARTETVVQPPQVSVGYDGMNIYGVLRPRTGFVATLKRGDTAISQVGGSTNSLSQFWAEFTQTAQTGDIIQVVGGDVVITTTFVSPRDLTFDPDHDLITGTLDTDGAGRRIRFGLTDRFAPSWENGCADTTVNADGSFVLNFAASGYDMQPGDSIFWYRVSMYDTQGNAQQLTRQGAVPYIEVYPGQHTVGGYWRKPGPITLTLWSSGGVLKSKVNGSASMWNSSFQEQFTSPVEPGDRVAVSDGVVTMTRLFCAHPDGVVRRKGEDHLGGRTHR